MTYGLKDLCAYIVLPFNSSASINFFTSTIVLHLALGFKFCDCNILFKFLSYLYSD